MVETVRSDGEGELAGSLSDLRRTRDIRHEYTPAGSPELNGVAKRAIGMIEQAATAARMQAKILCALNVPARMWAKSYRWAVDAQTLSATTANPEEKSPDELLFGEVTGSSCTHSSSQDNISTRGHGVNVQSIGVLLLGVWLQIPSLVITMLTKGRYVITTRNITWFRYPPRERSQRCSCSRRGGESCGM